MLFGVYNPEKYTAVHLCALRGYYFLYSRNTPRPFNHKGLKEKMH